MIKKGAIKKVVFSQPTLFTAHQAIKKSNFMVFSYFEVNIYSSKQKKKVEMWEWTSKSDFDFYIWAFQECPETEKKANWSSD